MTNYRPTQSALSFLLNTVSQYQAPCVFLYAAAVLLIVSVITGGKRARAAFLWPAAVLAATVFNPYVFPLLLSIRAEIVEHYFEFLWAVPATLIIAGGAVAAISGYKTRRFMSCFLPPALSCLWSSESRL